MGRALRMLLLAAVAAGLALPAHAVVLRYEAKKGDRLKYNITMNGRINMQYPPEVAAQMPPGMDTMTMNMTLSMEQVAEAVDTDTITWLMRTQPSSLSLQMGTEPAETQTVEATEVRMKMTKRGQVVEVKPVSGTPQVPGMEDLSSFLQSQPTPMLPAGDVRPGHTWTDSLDIPILGPDQSIRVSMQSTFKREATLRGRRVAEIETKMTGPFSFSEQGAQVKGDLSATMTTFHDIERGLVMETRGPMQMRMEMTMTGSGGTSTMTQGMIFTILMQLVD